MLGAHNPQHCIHIKCTNENESIKLNIYYKNRKVSNLVMKNSPNTTKLQRTNILYKYECNVGIVSPKHIYRIYTNNPFPQNYNAPPIWSTAQTQPGFPQQHINN